jgi:hypothetical protein
LSWRCECSWHFFVEIIDVIFELAFALVGSEVEGEGLLVADHLALLLIEPLAVVLVEEVPIPGLVPEHTEVLK